MKSTIRPAAREDILRQYRYYLIEQNAEEIAQRFLHAVEIAIQQLHSHPHIGSPRIFSNPALAGLRSWPVRGFPAIRIYYLFAEEELRVIRVLHGKRDIHAVLENESVEN
jgi:toxin ParE1/3/4